MREIEKEVLQPNLYVLWIKESDAGKLSDLVHKSNPKPKTKKSFTSICAIIFKASLACKLIEVCFLSGCRVYMGVDFLVKVHIDTPFFRKPQRA